MAKSTTKKNAPELAFVDARQALRHFSASQGRADAKRDGRFDWDKQLVNALTVLFNGAENPHGRGFVCAGDREHVGKLVQLLLQSLAKKLGVAHGSRGCIPVAADVRASVATLVLYAQAFYLAAFHDAIDEKEIEENVAGAGGLLSWMAAYQRSGPAGGLAALVKSVLAILRVHPRSICLLWRHFAENADIAAVIAEQYRRWYHAEEYALAAAIAKPQSLWWMAENIDAGHRLAWMQHVVAKDIVPSWAQAQQALDALDGGSKPDVADVFRQHCIRRLPLHERIDACIELLCRQRGACVPRWTLLAGGLLLKQGHLRASLQVLASTSIAGAGGPVDEDIMADHCKCLELAGTLSVHLKCMVQAVTYFAQALCDHGRLQQHSRRQSLQVALANSVEMTQQEGCFLAGVSRKLLDALLAPESIELGEHVVSLLASIDVSVQDRFMVPIVLGRLSEDSRRERIVQRCSYLQCHSLLLLVSSLFDPQSSLARADCTAVPGRYRSEISLWDGLVRLLEQSDVELQYGGKHPVGTVVHEFAGSARTMLALPADQSAEKALRFDASLPWTKHFTDCLQELSSVGREHRKHRVLSLGSLQLQRRKIVLLSSIGDLYAIRRHPGDVRLARKYYRTALYNLPHRPPESKSDVPIAKWPWLQNLLDSIRSKLEAVPAIEVEAAGWPAALMTQNRATILHHISAIMETGTEDVTLLAGLLHYYCLMPALPRDIRSDGLVGAVSMAGERTLSDTDCILLSLVPRRGGQGHWFCRIQDGQLHRCPIEAQQWSQLEESFADIVRRNRESVSRTATAGVEHDEQARRQWWRRRGALESALDAFVGAHLLPLVGADGECDGSETLHGTTRLVLDVRLHRYPWEQCWPRRPIARLWSSCPHSAAWPACPEQHAAHRQMTYVLNPQGDLVNTQQTLQPKLTALKGICGRTFADEAEFRHLCLHHCGRPSGPGSPTTNELFMYFGHSGPTPVTDVIAGTNAGGPPEHYAPAWLLGCSSAVTHYDCSSDGNAPATASKEREESESPTQAWLNRGARLAVGTLWDVTDRDIDRFAIALAAPMHVFGEWHGSEPDNSGMDYSEWPRALCEAREHCLLRHLNGSAPVLYQLECGHGAAPDGDDAPPATQER